MCGRRLGVWVKVVPWKVQGATMRMCKLLQNAFEPVLVLTKF